MKRGGPLKRTPFKRQPKTPPEKLVWKGITVPGETTKPMRKAPIKRSRPKSTPERKSANGEPCLIRLPGCGHADGTVVLCHYRLLPYCGAGMKPPDELGAFGCRHCHDIVDERAPAPPGWTMTDVWLAHAEGVLRTQLRLKELRETA